MRTKQIPEKDKERWLDQYSPQINKLFSPQMWHHLALIGYRDGKNVCYWCFLPATHIALVNIWGTVFVTPACEECFKTNNGIARDSL